MYIYIYIYIHTYLLTWLFTYYVLLYYICLFSQGSRRESRVPRFGTAAGGGRFEFEARDAQDSRREPFENRQM